MSQPTDVVLPDIGDFDKVDVIEVLVSPGDKVSKEDSLITLESDKATMEVPSPHEGTVKQVKVKVGDQIAKGDLILQMETGDGAARAEAPQAPKAEQPKAEQAPAAAKAPGQAAAPKAQPPSGEPVAPQPSPTAGLAEVDEGAFAKAHASPAVRRFARELGVDLARVGGSGPKGRVLKEDVQAFVKESLKGGGAPAGGPGLQLPSAPAVDFSQFGDIEAKPLTKIQRVSGANLARNWVSIPHVTQFGEADITALEAFRKEQGEIAKKQGVKLTPLAFFLKACVAALKQFPEFNSSLAPNGEELILKRYFHIGVAVDTPNGLMVPVIRDVDKKGLFDLAQEVVDASVKARDRKLSPADMQGGCFSISSLGGIGGTAFTPIINAPEVAILGVSRSEWKPVYKDGEFEPRLMLPLSLSYDHRVIDGALAARFMVYLCDVLSDIRRLLL